MVKPSSAAATATSDHRTTGEANKYTGVRKRKWGKWVSEIRLPNSRERIWLGSYDSPEKAARAFDAALFCLRGTTANFNFPHQPPHIPGGTDLPPSQIQAAAARYANTHSTISSSSSSSLSLSLSSSSSEEEEDEKAPSPHIQIDPWSLNDFPYMDIPELSGVMPDFGIYPGFDDYFMTPPDNYNEEEEEEDIYFQYPSTFLWNF